MKNFILSLDVMHELKASQVSPDSAFEFLKEVLKWCRKKFVPLLSKCSDHRREPKLPRQVLQFVKKKQSLAVLY